MTMPNDAETAVCKWCGRPLEVVPIGWRATDETGSPFANSMQCIKSPAGSHEPSTAVPEAHTVPIPPIQVRYEPLNECLKRIANSFAKEGREDEAMQMDFYAHVAEVLIESKSRAEETIAELVKASTEAVEWIKNDKAYTTFIAAIARATGKGL